MTTSIDEQTDTKVVANAIIGERVHTQMWRRGKTQTQLAKLLGVTQGSVSNRLRGKTLWTATEVLVVSAWLDVQVTELMPAFDIVGPDGDPDDSAGGAPTRARTWDLRIKSP